MSTGYVSFLITTSEGAFPIKNAQVFVQTTNIFQDKLNRGAFTRVNDVSEDYFDYKFETDENGKTKNAAIEAPSPEVANDEFSQEIPYTICDCFIQADGFVPVRIKGLQVFGANESNVPISLITYPNAQTEKEKLEIFDIPANTLTVKTERDREAASETEATAFVQRRVIIPETMIVHIGIPGDNGRNVYLNFPDYVKNCASSEIYPTWDESALRANIYAIISLALNRVFTEWYPSKGYPYYITNSTRYDQAFVEGRNIFSNINKIVDEIFNIYILKDGTINPYFAEYCDGKKVSCSGMSQWGTTYLAAQGYTPLQILQYYYGENIKLATTNLIIPITSSYPGTPLSLGSRGEDVATIQRQLNRISNNYPSINKIPTVNGIFGAYTDSAVRQFQTIFDLTPDGIVGKSTWYSIGYIYTAVKKLAELTSEGITAPVPENPPTAQLEVGDSGDNVKLLQYLLSYISLFYNTVPYVNIDGVFAERTKNSVMQYQKTFEMPQTGKIAEEDWDKLFLIYNSILETILPLYPEQIYANKILKVGSSGEEVLLIQKYLNVIANKYPEIPKITEDGQFGEGTKNAVIAFQKRLGLTADGIVGLLTWARIVEIYNFINSGKGTDAFAIQDSEIDENFPLRFGSSGEKICQLQGMLNAVNKTYDGKELNINCYYGNSTRTAVTIYQKRKKLKQTGNADFETWDILKNEYEEKINGKQ